MKSNDALSNNMDMDCPRLGEFEGSKILPDNFDRDLSSVFRDPRSFAALVSDGYNVMNSFECHSRG